jgi:hypothetical protein
MIAGVRIGDTFDPRDPVTPQESDALRCAASYLSCDEVVRVEGGVEG